MFESVFQAFERLVTEFSWRRLTFWIISLAVLGAACWSYETYTSHFKLRKLERAAALLARLETLRRQPNAFQDSALASAYRGISNQLDTTLLRTGFMPSISPTVWRGIAGAAPWILLVLAFLPNVRTGDTASAIAGFLILAAVFGLVGIILPTALGPNVLYVVYPLGAFFTVMLIAVAWQAAKNRALGGPQVAVASLRSDLRNLVTAQEMYFADHVEYASKLTDLNFSPSPGVVIRQITRTKDGWIAVASHEQVSVDYGIRIGTVEGPFKNAREGVPFPIKTPVT